jgi:hypothetical protein
MRLLQKAGALLGQLGMSPQRGMASTSSRAARISSFTARVSSRRISQWPPRQALTAALVLPSAVRGPVDRSQGLQAWIAAACLALRSGVQPVAMRGLQ